MNTSAAWINDYLDIPATPEEQAELLTRAGFPFEGSEEVSVSTGRDMRQDFEMTSNRGDCTCHLGLAREIAAISGRTLKAPDPKPQGTGPAASSTVAVKNQEKERCPLYTARIITGVRIGPSPPWLQDRLIARGDIPRNNVVDATNFVLFELGQPTHVFDLAKLKGPKIIIRKAKPSEPFLPIGEGAAQVKLTPDDLVIADAEDAVAMAGVKGGALTAVTEATIDILIEAATFDPVTVRNTSRRYNISSDSSFRFERGVHPAQVNHAAERLVELILETAGGTLHEGVVADGASIPDRTRLTMRCDRCRSILGVPADDEMMVASLKKLGFEPKLDAGVIHCTVPTQRLDIEREIDVIEEVGRMFGHDNIPIAEKLDITVAPPQPKIQAGRAVSDALVGMGYLETVTHTLISQVHAQAFLPPGMSAMRVDEARAAAEPVLRPSIVPSLLRVFAHNRDNGVKQVQLFEAGSVFAWTGENQNEHNERVNLAIVHTAPSAEDGLRRMRGVIDRLVEIIMGPEITIDVEPDDRLPWLRRDAGAAVQMSGEHLGAYGIVEPQSAKLFDVDEMIFAAEIGLPAFYEQYPPLTLAGALPNFPAIERDLSVILDEKIRWSRVYDAVSKLTLEHAERIDFVTTFRGKQIGKGRKSLTLRLRFRAPDRTLKHDEVDVQMEQVMQTLKSAFDAELRG